MGNSLPQEYNDPEFCHSSGILPHQTETINRLRESSRGLLIFHDVGTGKTLISLLAHVERIRPKTFFVAKPILQENFKMEAKKHKIDISTVNFLTPDSSFSGMNKSLIIIDEVHEFIYQTITSGKVSKLRKNYEYLKDLDDVHFLLLTATPIYKYPLEIAGIFNLFEPDSFPTDGQKFLADHINSARIEARQPGLIRHMSSKYVSRFSMVGSKLYPKDLGTTIENYKVPDKTYISPEAELFPNKSTKYVSAAIKSLIKKNGGKSFVYCQLPDYKLDIEGFTITPKNYMKLADTDQSVIIGSEDTKSGISLLGCNFAYIIMIPDTYGEIQQVFGRVKRVCSHANAKDNTIKYYLMIPDTNEQHVRNAYRNVGFFYKINENILSLMSEAGY